METPSQSPVPPLLAADRIVSGEVEITLTVNGQPRRFAIEPGTTLVDAIRDGLAMTGTKVGCAHGQCGACTVLVNGERRYSCLTLAIMHDGAAITTIEGVAGPDGALHPLQAAFIAHDAFQCGFCTPGQIMSALGFLGEGEPLTEASVRGALSGNLCRCAAYQHIVTAVREVGQSAAHA